MQGLWQYTKVYRRFYSVYKAKLSFCLKCWKNTGSKSPKVSWTKNKRISSKCVVCDSKKSKFFKQQKASGLLPRLEIKTPLNKVLLLGNLLL